MLAVYVDITSSFKSIMVCAVSVFVACFVRAQSNIPLIDSTALLRPVFSIEVPAKTLAHAERQEGYDSLLALFLVRNDAISTIPVTGQYTYDHNKLSFQPSVDLGHHLNFVLRYITPSGVIEQMGYHTPKATLQYKNPPNVVDIYPTSNVVPENILCFHILFDRPMAKDLEAYNKARIFEDSIEVPLVWKHQAYWTQNGQLLVLMVHPGRIKRGISYLGKAFEDGHHYTLVIEQEIKDPQGRTLSQTVKKEFSVSRADHKIPKIKKNGIVFPEVPGTSSIDLTFSEGMDYACMVEGLQVLDSSNHPIAIRINHLSDNEFRLTPLETWQPGAYRLVLGPIVGDLCGNRFNRKFETRKKPTSQQLNADLIFEFVIH